MKFIKIKLVIPILKKSQYKFSNFQFVVTLNLTDNADFRKSYYKRIITIYYLMSRAYFQMQMQQFTISAL